MGGIPAQASEIKFSAHLAPVAKQRPRVTKNGTFTPQRTAYFERQLRILSRKYMPKYPLLGPLRVTLDFYVTLPKSPKDPEWPTQRPDLDNYVKAVLDGLGSIWKRDGLTHRRHLIESGFWKDDAQVVDLRARKMYSYVNKGRHPWIEITIVSLK